MSCECDNSGRVDQVHDAVFGNGKPENSILVRLANIEKTSKTARNLAWLILGTMIAIGAKGAATWISVGPPNHDSSVTVASAEGRLND